MIAAAILAGGAATRMGGRAKGLLLVEGRRIVDRQLDVLRARFSELWIIANDPTPYAGLDVPIAGDVVAGQGPLGGLLTALEVAHAAQVFVVACDMPHISGAAIAQVVDAAETWDVVVPVVNGLPEPLFARYARSCAPAIRRRLAAGERKVTGFYPDVRVARIPGKDLGLALSNWNTPDDMI